MSTRSSLAADPRARALALLEKRRREPRSVFAAEPVLSWLKDLCALKIQHQRTLTWGDIREILLENAGEVVDGTAAKVVVSGVEQAVNDEHREVCRAFVEKNPSKSGITYFVEEHLKEEFAALVKIHRGT